MARPPCFSIDTMKRFLLCAMVAIAAVACKPGEDPNALWNPEFTITGAPTEPVEAYDVFTLTVSSLSDGVIYYEVDKPELVSIALRKRRVYSVATGAPEQDTPITITFTQDDAGGYDAASAVIKFTIKKKEAEEYPAGPSEDLDGVKVSFTESFDHITNPERGFYCPADIRKASQALTAEGVLAQRRLGRTLFYLGFIMSDFVDKDLPQEQLDLIQGCFDALREGGAKCILRFSYSDSEGETPWDADIDVVMRHVEQLKPLLQQNADVIFVMQAGFVGVWGEWYYTSHFNSNPKTDQDWAPRKNLVDALLEALPENRQIQLRTPKYKMKMYGMELKDTITAATAYQPTVLARLGGHNDCFGADANDRGTFESTVQRNYWKAETRYTIMGGETCEMSVYCLCSATLQNMKDYHWTYLNNTFHGGVISRWKETGCYNQIVDRLGYRLTLQDLFYTPNPSAGKEITITLRIGNRGFAAPMNPRNAYVVFKGSDGSVTKAQLDADPRTWHPGWHVAHASLTMPVSKGTFYLELSDPMLTNRPEYSIALANEGVFDSETGLNKLFELK